METIFEFTGASVIGRSHRVAGRNNQDAWCTLHSPECTVAVVCDGCGSGGKSEIGAGIGVRLVANSLICQVQRQAGSSSCSTTGEAPAHDNSSLLDATRAETLEYLRQFATGMGGSLASAVNDFLLFTIVGALITPITTTFFAIGDGLVVVNEERIVLGPFPDNAPPYLAYGLVENSLSHTGPDTRRFQLLRELPTSQLRSFLIGTDGVHDLHAVAARRVPGKSDTVGPLSQFWTDDRYYANPDLLRRKLAGVNRDITSPDPTGVGLQKVPGLLHDDTTIIAGRRRGIFGKEGEA